MSSCYIISYETHYSRVAVDADIEMRTISKDHGLPIVLSTGEWYPVTSGNDI